MLTQAKLHQKGQFLKRKIEIKNYNIVNYRPVSILKCFSKICEIFFYYQVVVYINKISLDLKVVNRKGFGTSHVLVKLIENWKKVLDNSIFFTKAMFMDLFKGVQKSCSQVFYCIPHDLLIMKLHTYGLTFDIETFTFSYLKEKKQNMKINNIGITLLRILSGVSQGSILGPILFETFLNDLFCLVEEV